METTPLLLWVAVERRGLNLVRANKQQRGVPASVSNVSFSANLESNKNGKRGVVKIEEVSCVMVVTLLHFCALMLSHMSFIFV